MESDEFDFTVGIFNHIANLSNLNLGMNPGGG
jgi:hypothetical protein